MINYDPFSYEGTLTLLQAVEKIDAPSNFLSQTFFPNKISVLTDTVAIEYRKEGRQAAPYIVKGAKGVNIARNGSHAKMYSAPKFGARRVISAEDVEHRLFGETPNIFSPVKAEERQARLMAQDLAQLTRMIQTRREVMASEVLQTGKLTMNAYADDGRIVSTDTIDFETGGASAVIRDWDDATAKIYDDLYNTSEYIQENTGAVPTVAICGKNVEKYLLANNEIKNWLMIPNRQNLAMMNLQPHFQSPQIRYIGTISALNLELYSYNQTYIDETGQKKYFVEPDNIIIGNTGTGRTIFQPVTLMFNGQFKTISAEVVPHYTHNDDDLISTLTLYSRFILVPEVLEDFVVLKVKQ